MKKSADLYRMYTAEHICPYGIKSKYLLEKEGFEVVDHLLDSREQIDAFKAKHDVKTTPQTFIDGKRIGGYDDLEKYFGIKKKDKDAVTYKPVIAVFATAALLALATSLHFGPLQFGAHTIELFVAISFCLLGLLKLQDLQAFSAQFITYDLLGRKYLPYSYIYPFVEVLSAVSMIAMVGILISAPLAIFTGTVGAISVFKAVYIEKRPLKCACVGGNSNVPLGFVSLTENFAMLGMGIWMLFLK